MSRYHHGDLPAALIRAAETILERDGIKAMTLRAAAREAGVSHAAPLHHFGDLTGLLSELAASGFTRLRDHIVALVDGAGSTDAERLKALGRAYVSFAENYPGLFQLMFRAERLDWARPALAQAGAAAIALIHGPGQEDIDAGSYSPEMVGQAMARWSLIHGMAMLSIDGRLGEVSTKIFRTDAADVRAYVLDHISRI